MTRKMTKTWLQLYDRLGHQPLSKTRDKNILFKDENGNFIPLKLVFDPTGNDWWLEGRKENE